MINTEGKIMNLFQTQLYNDLNNLVEHNEAFFKSEFVVDGLLYQIFNYRFASYTDFLQPAALTCRGTMFCVDGDDINLVSLPMDKCFNMDENPFTMDLNLSTIESIEVKSDGSLISTYIHKGLLKLKSKGSLSSEQAIDAMQWLDRNPEYKQALYDSANNGYTVNLEWVGQCNRIVLSYDKPQLIMLNVRDNTSGISYYVNDLDKLSTVIDYHKTIFNLPVDIEDKQQFVLDIPEMHDNIEGFIVRLKDGTIFKRKTKQYITLHNAISDIKSPKKLLICIVDDVVDDLLSIIDDPILRRYIEICQHNVGIEFNHLIVTIESFVELHKNLSRKDFAILSQQVLTKMEFSLAMSKFIGREPNYRNMFIQNYMLPEFDRV